MTLAQIIAARHDLFNTANNAGDGYDPADDGIANETPVYASQSDDDVAVYVLGDDAVLVGDANGAWAVRVAVAS